MKKKVRENQSFIAEILKLLTPGRANNSPGNVTLVMVSPAEGTVN